MGHVVVMPVNRNSVAGVGRRLVSKHALSKHILYTFQKVPSGKQIIGSEGPKCPICVWSMPQIRARSQGRGTGAAEGLSPTAGLPGLVLLQHFGELNVPCLGG